MGKCLGRFDKGKFLETHHNTVQLQSLWILVWLSDVPHASEEEGARNDVCPEMLLLPSSLQHAGEE